MYLLDISDLVQGLCVCKGEVEGAAEIMKIEKYSFFVFTLLAYTGGPVLTYPFSFENADFFLRFQK